MKGLVLAGFSTMIASMLALLSTPPQASEGARCVLGIIAMVGMAAVIGGDALLSRKERKERG